MMHLCMPTTSKTTQTTPGLHFVNELEFSQEKSLIVRRENSKYMSKLHFPIFLSNQLLYLEFILVFYASGVDVATALMHQKYAR